jgi:hypothetical protein
VSEFWWNVIGGAMLLLFIGSMGGMALYAVRMLSRSNLR